MKITGERVVSPAGGFNPTWQRHVAGYALCEPFLGPGRVVDLGCGVGHSYHLLDPRETVGVDLDPQVLAGQDRPTVVADMRDLPFPDASFSSIVAVQSLEHVPDPNRTLAEAARVLEPEGVAVFITPNRLTLGRPDEIIDPYHYVEFDDQDLRRLCELWFAEVEVVGLSGSERYLELFREERRTLSRLLRLDPLRLRRLVPRRIRQRLYDALLRAFRSPEDPRAEAIGVDDFELRNGPLDLCLDLVAVCRRPLAPDRGQARSYIAAPACVWCGAAFDGGATKLRGRTICPDCGAATTDPWPSEQELDRAYGSWYRPPSGRRFAFIGDPLLRHTRAALAGRLDQIAPPGPVLDVGAGEGVLIDALTRRGRAATGIERGPRRPDLRLDPIERIDGEWAAVVFWHSLEHLPNPGEAVRHAARILRSGGVIVIAVPNSASLQARAFGDRWLHLDPPLHLVHLSESALCSRLAECGFVVERVSHVRGGQIVIGWLDGLVGTLPGQLGLYQALRRAEARGSVMSPAQRVAALVAGVVLLPLAAVCAAVEIFLGRSGTVCVEARRA
ncbi:MAG: methyltransferase domain-containing protein [Actinomycetota bacterium]